MGKDEFDGRGDKCWMKKEVLSGVSEKGDLIDGLFVLLHDFKNLNGNSITLPGHQGYGSTLAHTSLPYTSYSFTDIRFQILIRLINVFWKLPLSLKSYGKLALINL